jgi:hypothetical protein
LVRFGFPTLHIVQLLPQLPIQRQIVPCSAGPRDIDQGKRVQVAQNFEADLGRQVSDEVDVETGIQLLNDLRNDTGREIVEERHGQLCSED